jgi:hypothetical protein
VSLGDSQQNCRNYFWFYIIDYLLQTPVTVSVARAALDCVSDNLYVGDGSENDGKTNPSSVRDEVNPLSEG